MRVCVGSAALCAWPSAEARRVLMAQSLSFPLIGYLRRTWGIVSRPVGAFDLCTFDSLRKKGEGVEKRRRLT